MNYWWDLHAESTKLNVSLHFTLYFLYRAATNCDLYVLSKKSLDETFQYYPAIYKQLQRASEMMRKQLYQDSHHNKISRKPKSAAGVFQSQTGRKWFFTLIYTVLARSHTQGASCSSTGKQIYWILDFRQMNTVTLVFLTDLKLFSEYMAEAEHTALESIWWTAVKEIFTSLFLLMKRIHNKTIDPENTVLLAYQYISCLLITVLFWAITYMVCMESLLHSNNLLVIVPHKKDFWNDYGYYLLSSTALCVWR